MDKILEHIKKIKEEHSKIKLLTTYQTLNQVNDVIKYHNKTIETENDAIIIDIYGLLQSLFVGVDSLYSLTIGITSNKFEININQNQTLSRLKHIRNDIVGHPTNRKYGNFGIAYSLIDPNSLKYNEFKYQTYLFNGNKYTTEETIVNLNELKDAYLTEKNIIINRLTDYIAKDYKTINLDNEIYLLLNDITENNVNIVYNKFVNHYGNLEKHRFMWRLSLVKKYMNWQNNDPEIQNVIDYAIKEQIIKMLSISNQMEKKKNKLPKQKLPYLLKKMFKFLDNNHNYIEYIKNIHDVNSIYFKSDLNFLINNTLDKSVLKLLNFLKEQKDSNKIFLIGSAIKKYNKKYNV